MKGNCALSGFLMTKMSFGHDVMAAGVGLGLNAGAIRKKLLEGNKRYIEAKQIHPNQTVGRRLEVSKGQHPFAAILTCSDSRVPPEIIFDQGLGDLFVIRLAGNILDNAALGSLEFAVDHLGIGYIMVLGHSHCCTVEAAVRAGEAHGHIVNLIKAIKPALDRAKKLPGGAALDNVVRANIALVAEQLESSSSIMAEHVRKGALTITGAYYDLETGSVEFLPKHEPDLPDKNQSANKAQATYTHLFP